MSFFCHFASLVYVLMISYYPMVAFSGETIPANNELTPLVVTAKGGFSEPYHSTAWSISSLETKSNAGTARSLPEALSGIPSILIQKQLVNPRHTFVG